MTFRRREPSPTDRPADPAQVAKWAASDDVDVVAAVAGNPTIAVDVLQDLAEHPEPVVRQAVMANPAIATHRDLHPWLLELLATEPDVEVGVAALTAGWVPADQRAQFVHTGGPAIRGAVARDRSAPADLLTELTAIEIAVWHTSTGPQRLDATRTLDRLSKNPATPPAALTALAAVPNHLISRSLQHRSDLPADALPALVNALADDDPGLGVAAARYALSRQDCPGHVVDLLARSDDNSVARAAWAHTNGSPVTRAYGLAYADTHTTAQQITSDTTLLAMAVDPATVPSRLRPVIDELIRRGYLPTVIGYLDLDGVSIRRATTRSLITHAEQLDHDTAHQLAVHPRLYGAQSRATLMQALAEQYGMDDVAGYVNDPREHVRQAAQSILTVALD